MCDLRICRTRPNPQVHQEAPEAHSSLCSRVTGIALNTLYVLTGVLIGVGIIAAFGYSVTRIEKDTCPVYTAENCHPICSERPPKKLCFLRTPEWYEQPTLVHAIQDRFPECSEPEQDFIRFMIAEIGKDMHKSLPQTFDDQCPSFENVTCLSGPVDSGCESLHYGLGFAVEDIKQLAEYSFAADPKQSLPEEPHSQPQVRVTYIDLEDHLPMANETMIF